MPRSLPWLVNASRQESRERDDAKTPTPRARRASPRTPPKKNESEGNQESAAWETPRHIDVLRSSRSPPTSPIHAPPTEEYIIEGFDNDDMYIMVEDEFYAVAQLFTRHLHHAEYVRRRKEAKAQNVSVIKSLSRPTDGKTAMSRETLKRKESERLQELQKQALSTPRRPRAESDEEGEEEVGASDLDEDREDDPWYGTSLHTLMTSPRKNKSLVGLDGIRSNTRAAAGYRPEVASQRSVVHRQTESVSRREPVVEPVAVASSEDDDDLEIIESRSSRPVFLPQSEVRTRPSVIKRESPEANVNSSVRQHTNGRNTDHVRRYTSEAKLQTAVKPPTLSKQRNTIEIGSNTESPSNSPLNLQVKGARPRKRLLLDDIDDLVEVKEEEEEKLSIHNTIQDQPRRLSSNTSSRLADRAQNGSTAKKSRLNNVPTFLV